MPNASSHGWPRATSLALLVPLLLSLPSCLTVHVWSGSHRDTHRAGIASTATAVTIADGGVQSIAVQLAEDLPATVATALDRAANGRWFEVRLSEPSPALAEIVRLRNEGALSSASFTVWLSGDEDASIEATASIDDAKLAAVRVAPQLLIGRDGNEPTQLRARARGKLHPVADAPRACQAPVGASVSYSLPASEARPLWAKVALTPATAVMDVVFTPVALLAAPYVWALLELGGAP